MNISGAHSGNDEYDTHPTYRDESCDIIDRECGDVYDKFGGSDSYSGHARRRARSRNDHQDRSRKRSNSSRMYGGGGGGIRKSIPSSTFGFSLQDLKFLSTKKLNTSAKTNDSTRRTSSDTSRVGDRWASSVGRSIFSSTPPTQTPETHPNNTNKSGLHTKPRYNWARHCVVDRTVHPDIVHEIRGVQRDSDSQRTGSDPQHAESDSPHGGSDFDTEIDMDTSDTHTRSPPDVTDNRAGGGDKDVEDEPSESRTVDVSTSMGTYGGRRSQTRTARVPPPQSTTQPPSSADQLNIDPEHAGNLWKMSLEEGPTGTRVRSVQLTDMSIDKATGRFDMGPSSTQHCNMSEWIVGTDTNTLPDSTADDVFRHRQTEEAWAATTRNAAHCAVRVEDHSMFGSTGGGSSVLEAGASERSDMLHKIIDKNAKAGGVDETSDVVVGEWSAAVMLDKWVRACEPHAGRSSAHKTASKDRRRQSGRSESNSHSYRAGDPAYGTGTDEDEDEDTDTDTDEADAVDMSLDLALDVPQGRSWTSLNESFGDDNPTEMPWSSHKYQAVLVDKLESLSLEVMRKYTLDRDKRRLKPRMEVEMMDSRCDTTVAGMRCLDLCFKTADKFKQKRSPDQIEFHDAIFQTCAPHIVGKKDYPLVRQQLMRRFGRTESNMAALIMTPRRWGKTTAVAMAVACMMYCSRGVTIVVFSTGQRMSTTFMDKVRGYYLELEGAGDRVAKSNGEEFVVTHSGSTKGLSPSQLAERGEVNRLLARAGDVAGNKGVSFDIAILEEASRIDEGILQEVIAPMMKVADSVLIGLTTHLGEDNYFTKLMDADTPAARRLFVRLRIELVCPRCKRLGVDPSSCHHLDHQHPPWLLGSNAERTKLLMAGNSKMYAQEALGVVMSDRLNLFQQQWIDRLRDRPLVSIPDPTKCFITTVIDPAGSGDSFWAICSVVRLPEDGSLIIVGLAEADPRDIIQTEEMMDVYFENLMKDPVLCQMDHIACIENNYGGPIQASSLFRSCLRSCPDLNEYRNKTIPGLVTTNHKKTSAAIEMQQALNTDGVHFYQNMVTLDPSFDAANSVRADFLTQMLSIRKEYKATGRYSYSGKDGNGSRDDTSICALLASHVALEIANVNNSRAARHAYNS